MYQRRYWTDRAFDYVDAVGAIAKDCGMTSLDLPEEAVKRLDDCHYAFSGTDAKYAR
jgi:hypothetical protein